MKTSTTDKESALASLRKLVKPGDTVYTVLRHVSTSGMSRAVDVFVIIDSNPYRLSGFIARAGLFGYSDRWEALTVGGCGLDVGFEIVYRLSRELFKEPVCIGEDCPSNDHINGDRDYSPHPHSDGGYMLNHRWL